MRYKIYTIPIPDTQNAIEEMNRFLNTHRIITVEKHFLQKREISNYVFLVEYYEAKIESTGYKTPKIDYKEILSAQDFAIFNERREYRKNLSESEGKPVYTFFTNEQLAAIVQKKVKSKKTLKAIDGIGEAKIEKYGEGIINIYDGCEQ